METTNTVPAELINAFEAVVTNWEFRTCPVGGTVAPDRPHLFGILRLAAYRLQRDAAIDARGSLLEARQSLRGAVHVETYTAHTYGLKIAPALLAMVDAALV